MIHVNAGLEAKPRIAGLNELRKSYPNYQPKQKDDPEPIVPETLLSLLGLYVVILYAFFSHIFFEHFLKAMGQHQLTQSFTLTLSLFFILRNRESLSFGVTMGNWSLSIFKLVMMWSSRHVATPSSWTHFTAPKLVLLAISQNRMCFFIFISLFTLLNDFHFTERRKCWEVGPPKWIRFFSLFSFSLFFCCLLCFVHWKVGEAVSDVPLKWEQNEGVDEDEWDDWGFFQWRESLRCFVCSKVWNEKLLDKRCKIKKIELCDVNCQIYVQEKMISIGGNTNVFLKKEKRSNMEERMKEFSRQRAKDVSTPWPQMD